MGLIWKDDWKNFIYIKKQKKAPNWCWSFI